MSYAIATVIAAFLVVTLINALRGGFDGLAAGYVPVLFLLIVVYAVAVRFGARKRS